MFASASMDGAIVIWSSHRLDVIRQFNYYENFTNISDHTYPYKVNHLIMTDQVYISLVSWEKMLWGMLWR